MPTQQLDPIGDVQVQIPGVLAAARRNTNMSLCDPNDTMHRACRDVHGWVDPCLADREVRYRGETVPALDLMVERGLMTPDGCRVEKKCGTDFDTTVFRPFQWYDLEEVDCPNPTIPLAELADNEVERGTAKLMARELEQSILEPRNPSLASSAVFVNSTPAHPCDALGMLLEALDDRGFTSGTLFGPRRALPALRATGSLSNGFGGGYRLEGLPFGVGIQGVPPHTVPTADVEDASEPGTGWLYAVGSAVEYNISDLPPVEGFHARQNWWAHESLRRGVWRFNPLCSFAVWVCLKKESCCG